MPLFNTLTTTPRRLPFLAKDGFVWFNGISTTIVNFITKPFFTYLLDIWFLNLRCRYTLLNDQTVLFLTIQFSTSQLLKVLKYWYVSLTIDLNIYHLFTQLNDHKSLVWTQFICQSVLFDPLIVPDAEWTRERWQLRDTLHFSKL